MKPIPEIKISIQIGEKFFDRNINEDLEVHPHNLDEALMYQASLYAYYSIRLQQMNALRDQAEFEYDKALNEHMSIVRDELTGSGVKTTDKIVTAMVNSRPEVLEARQKFLDKSSDRDQLYALVRALEHKKDAVIALAYQRRSEMEAIGLNVKKRTEIPKSGIEDE